MYHHIIDIISTCHMYHDRSTPWYPWYATAFPPLLQTGKDSQLPPIGNPSANPYHLEVAQVALTRSPCFFHFHSKSSTGTIEDQQILTPQLSSHIPPKIKSECFLKRKSCSVKRRWWCLAITFQTCKASVQLDDVHVCIVYTVYIYIYILYIYIRILLI